MLTRLITSMSKVMNENSVRKGIQQKADDKALAEGPSWRYRRKLIYGAYFLGFGMVVFGASTVFLDSMIGVELIIGGVALVSIIVTAYTTSATYEDVRLWNHTPRIRFGQDQNHGPMHNYETNNPDGN